MSKTNDYKNKDFSHLDELNNKAHEWIENDYNSQHHSGIQMKPIDKFTLDHTRLTFLYDENKIYFLLKC